jgi:hypothetical protein
VADLWIWLFFMIVCPGYFLSGAFFIFYESLSYKVKTLCGDATDAQMKMQAEDAFHKIMITSWR